MVSYCESTICRHRFILSYFDENVQECEELCDLCTESEKPCPKDCTLKSKLIIEGLLAVEEKQKKVTVLLLTQFLSLNVSSRFGSANAEKGESSCRE